MARPTKFTPERAKRIIELVRKGNFKTTAARASGVNPATLDRWIVAGREGRNKALREFCAALEDAEAQAEIDAVAKWQVAHEKSPAEIKEFLRRRFPDNWNVPDKRESTVTYDDKNMEVIDLRFENFIARYNERRRKVSKNGNVKPVDTDRTAR